MSAKSNKSNEIIDSEATASFEFLPGDEQFAQFSGFFAQADFESKKDDDKKIKGTDGDDVLMGNEKNNDIDGKEGNDEIYGLQGNDHLDGDEGDDLLSGGEGNDKLHGKDGNDLLLGGAGNDDLKGDDGDDVLQGDDGNDKLEGKSGNDILEGGAGNDKLDGGEGDDTLQGGLGKDDIKAGKGDDSIIWNAGDGKDKIDGGSGEDSFTLTTSDTVKQNVHIDVNSKGNLVVTLDGGDEGGELELKNIESLNLQFGLAGATVELGGNAGEVLGDAPLALAGGGGGDVIDASSSDQPVAIDSGTGDDTVTGGTAADEISGGEGADVITGGGGDDVIDAGVGDDQVIWAAGDGNDIIDGGEGFDELNLTLDETVPSNLSISADADGNVILIADDGTKLTVDGVEDIVINAGAAGTTLTIGDLTGTDIAQDTLYFVGGAGDDSLDASATDRRINAQGNDGNDILLSGSGNDILDGGAGNDTLDAGGGLGADNISGGTGDDLIIATLGDQQGSFAVDLIDGGADNDQLNVIFVEPTSHDLLLRVKSNGDGSFSVTSEDIDVDESLHVSNVENLKITAGDGALNFVLDSLSDTSLAQNGVDFDGSADADFFDGSATDVVLNLSGNGGADTLIGGAMNDQLDGGDGNDSLSGSDGDDNLVGGAGDDIMDGGQGYDWTDYSSAAAGVTVDLGNFAPQDTGAAGVDTLVNIEAISGSDFADSLTGNNADNEIYGGAGNDTLIGGAGFDNLNGGAGDDNLSDADGGVLHGDAGNDFIDGMASYYTDPTGAFVNYSAADVDVHGDASLIITAGTAQDGYGDTDTFGAGARDLEGSAFNDHLTASDQNNWVYGRGGDDQIFGLAGNDRLFGGSGNDTLDGGDGLDFASYEEDGIDHLGMPGTGIDVDLTAGIVSDGFGGTDTLLNIENIVGSNAADTITGDAGANTLLARGGDDIVSGGAGDDILGGWSGDDTLDGGDGADLMIGDAGNDTLSGGTGADTYRFLTYSNDFVNDFGHDTITDFDVAEDVLDLSPFGITNVADVQAIASDDGTNTIITIDVDRSIVLQNITVAELTAPNFIFADPPGPGLTGTENNDVIVGTSGDDSIAGLEGDDSLEGKEGSDTLDGGAGDDTVIYANDAAGVTVNLSLGTATDGNGDTDTLIAIEKIRGSDFSDTLTGDAGDNVIWGDGFGGDGAADIIDGGDGNDSIIGGKGIDTIDGGDGLDAIYFSQDGIGFGQIGLSITFEADGSITSFNPHTGITESDIVNIEAVIGTIGTDTITGNAQDNYIQSYYGGSALDGGGGTNTVFFSIGVGVTVDLAAGIAYREGRPELGTDLLSNFQNVIGGPNNDVIGGDSLNNILEGVNGSDILRGGAGNDILNGGVSTLLTNFGNPDQTADGIDIADYSLDPAGVSVDLGNGSATDGWGDTDSFISIDGATGSEFADTIVGSSGDDKLTGLGGNDDLTGGDGSDSFVLTDDESGNASFGLDTVTDFNPLEDIVNVRAFNGISSMAELTITQDGTDTLIEFDPANILRLENVNVGDLDPSNFDFVVPLNLVGTEADDNLTGDDGNDSIIGLGGNDQLFGEDGDDFIDGGAGFDDIHGGGGNDTLNGGADWDNIWGDAGDDIINTGANGGWADGGDGNDTITGVNDFWDDLRGGAGDDTLIDPDGSGFVIGGPGNDSLDGRLGYEQDPAGVIINLANTDWNINSQLVAARTAIDGWGDTDTLLAGAIDLHGSHYDDYIQGSEFGQYFRLRAGNDTVFGFDGDDNFFGGSGNDYIDGGNGFDNVQYQDDGYDSAGAATQGVIVNLSAADFNYGAGTALANSAIDGFGSTDTLLNLEQVDGSELDDVLIGSDAHNWLRGHGGDDRLYGNGDGDNLVGGAGDDYLDGGAGDWDTAWYSWDLDHGINVNLVNGIATDDGYGNTDTLVSIENIEGSEFDDTIIGDANNNYLVGNQGNDIIHGGAGDDHLEGREGNDQLFGESGNDWLQASAGDELIDGGADRDTVTYHSYTGTTSGISLDMNAIVDAGGYTNVVVVSGDGFGGTDYLRSIERIHATDQNDFITGDASDNDFHGAAGNDTLVGGDGNDFLAGEDDFDTLDGGAGNDRLDGGENNDTLTGGADGDTFSFTRFTDQGDLTSFGEDIITDFSITEDHLSFYNVPEFSNLNALQSYAVQDGSDVLISFISNDFGVDETNSIRLQNLTLADLPNMNIGYSPLAGTEGDDILNGTEFGDNIQGLGGNDELNGNDGNDDLDGGPGDDSLNGGAGYDNLRGGPGNDALDGGTDWDNANYRWSGELNGVVVNLSTGTTSNDGFGNTDTLTNIENVEGSEFPDTITGDALDNHLDGREGDDVIHGGAGNDSLVGDQGDDALNGDAGDDNLRGGAGNDTLDGGADWDHLNYRWSGEINGVVVNLSTGVTSNDGFGNTDTLISIESVEGSEFTDHITGDALGNHLDGREGDDFIYGGAGDDSLIGDQGNDELYGEADNDWFLGQSGNDLIDGGAGIDQVNYDGWSGTSSGVSINLSIVEPIAGVHSNVVVVSNDGFGSIDYLRDIENISGTDFTDTLTGNAADNFLNGNGGDDFLSGGGGNDHLEGGAGNDTFILSDGDNLSIGDFVAGAGTEDVINLQAVSSLDDFTAVLAAATDDGGGNTNIDIGGSNIHLAGVNTANLHADDFIF